MIVVYLGVSVATVSRVVMLTTGVTHFLLPYGVKRKEAVHSYVVSGRRDGWACPDERLSETILRFRSTRWTTVERVNL
jgi:hypothetical protein